MRKIDAALKLVEGQVNPREAVWQLGIERSA